MVSTIRYSSFKTLGAGKRKTMKVMPIIAAVGMLVWLYSRYVLLAIVLAYVLHGILFRIWPPSSIRAPPKIERLSQPRPCSGSFRCLPLSRLFITPKVLPGSSTECVSREQGRGLRVVILADVDAVDLLPILQIQHHTLFTD